MAYTDEEIQQALFMLAGNVASGDSFNDAFARGSEKIKELRTAKTKSIETNLDITKKALEVQKLSEELGQGSDGPIEQYYSPQQMEVDATIHDAYGIVDSAIFAVGTIGETFGMSPTGTRESREAANNLHKDMKIILSGSFKGRPSNYLLKQIQELIPTIGNWVGGDAYAESRYRQIRQKFEQWVPELEAEIKIASGKTKVELVSQRAKAAQLVRRLDVVLDGFTQGETKPNVNMYPDIPTGYEFPDDDEGIASMLELFRQEIPGDEYKP